MAQFDENKAEMSANLDLITYLDYQDPYYNGRTIKEYIDDVGNKIDRNGELIKSRDDYKELHDLIYSNSELGNELANTRIVCQSHIDCPEIANYYTNEPHDLTKDPIQAFGFQDSQGNMYVAYRGTGEGRASDDGEGYYRILTEQQSCAADFFDACYSKTIHPAGSQCLVSGHSKGGNESMVPVFFSKNRDKIDACYCFDGQGFDVRTVSLFRYINGDENYANILKDKCFAINGDNDPIHPLIGIIIPDENTYYLKTDFDKAKNPLEKFAFVHDMKGFMNGGHLNFFRDDNNQIIKGQEGDFCKLGEILNKKIIELPEEDRRSVVSAMMELIDKGKPIDGQHANVIDYYKLFTIGSDVIFDSILEYVCDVGIEESVSSFNRFLGEVILYGLDKIYEEKGIMGLVAVVCITSMFGVGILKLAIHLVLDIALIRGICRVCDMIFDKIKVYFQSIPEWNNFITNVCNFWTSVKEWFFTHYPGYFFVSENPYIQVDTGSMRFIAACLNNVRDRAKDLDWRMNSLYFEMGINWDTVGNLASLLRAGIGLDYADRLGACANYLNDTADEFDSIESQLIH